MKITIDREICNNDSLKILANCIFVLHCLIFQSVRQFFLIIIKIDESILRKHDKLITKPLLYGNDKFDLSCNKSMIYSADVFNLSFHCLY